MLMTTRAATVNFSHRRGVSGVAVSEDKGEFAGQGPGMKRKKNKQENRRVTVRERASARARRFHK